MSENKGECGYTFIYGGSSHVVETQGCIHIIHVLQESKEILHLLKCDTLHKKKVTIQSLKGTYQSAVLLQSCEKSTNKPNTVQN